MPVINWLSLSRFIFLAFIINGCSTAHQTVQRDVQFSFYPDGRSSSFSQNKNLAPPIQESSSNSDVSVANGSAAMHRATLKSYNTFGIRYFPKIEDVGYEEYGIASWYGPDFHGKATSSGEIYDMHIDTAAHKTLPMHTIVEVTHRETGKKTVVRINDRGPFVEGRIIDLSYKAGKYLGMDVTGIAPIKIKVLSYDKHITSLLDNKDKVLAVDTTQIKNEDESVKNVQGMFSYFVQAGSFSDPNRAKNYSKELEAKFRKNKVTIKSLIKDDKDIYRVVISGFVSKEDAIAFINDSGLNAVVITE